MKRTLKRESKVPEIAWVEGMSGDMSEVNQVMNYKGVVWRG